MNNFTATPQWHEGAAVADFLDAFFTAKGWHISPTTPHEERVLCLGDRHFRRDDLHRLVEYKSGLQTATTGNVFLETVSVDTTHKPGWVYTCQADLILYAALLNHKILVFEPSSLRAHIEGLQQRFRTVQTGQGQNAGYATHGVIVPLYYAETRLTRKVIRIVRSFNGLPR